MATNGEALDKIKEYLNESYTRAETSAIPKKNDLTFGNTVKKIKHTKVFYIDMRKSRKILTDASDFWSIKIHKAFLQAVIHCVKQREGHIRSFNGDGILAFFIDDIDDYPASRAVRAAMDIKGFVNSINKILEENGKNVIDFGIGIAQGEIYVAKSGEAGDDQTKQDLVWIGVPLYVAVELSEISSSPRNIRISKHVRASILKDDNHLNVVYSTEHNDDKWQYSEKSLNNGQQKVYSTSWYFNP